MMLQLPQYTGHLLPRHYFRDSAFSTRPHDTFKLTDVPLKDVPEEKHEGIESLVLSRGRAAPLHRKVGQKSYDVFLSHLLRMLLSVKDNKPTDPTEVALLGGITEMPEPNSLPYEIQKFSGSFL
jgi:hypothetical protein